MYPSSQSTREHFHYPPKKPHITPTALGPASLVCHLSIDLPVRSLHINGSIHCLVFCDQLLSLNMFSRFIHVVACIRTSSPQAGIKIAGRNINNVSDSQRLHVRQPTRLLHPWGFPGKSTGVGCHCLLCPRVILSL